MSETRNCGICNKLIKVNCKALFCHICQNMIHPRCNSLNSKLTGVDINEVWSCLKCNSEIFPFHNSPENIDTIEFCSEDSDTVNEPGLNLN